MDEAAPRKKPLIPVAALAAVVLAATAVGFWPDGPEPATARPVASASASPLPAAVPSFPPTPFDQVHTQLTAQTKALVDGDEAGWLAPVDTKLRPRYRAIFKNLRALGLSSADVGIDGQLTEKGSTLTAKVGISYCFDGIVCPGYQLDPNGRVSKIINTLTWTSRAGSWVITKSAASGVENRLQPTPWEKSELTVARGARVTVAAPKSQAKNVKRVLRLAEKAAAVADRYAVRVNNPQKRYRVYLADDKAYKTWYTGSRPPWSVGYYIPLNGTSGDVIIKSSKVLPENDEYVTEIIQHEFGHVATLTGNRNDDDKKDQWLLEGIAEYIGYLPGKPQNTYSRDALRYVRSQGRAVKTMAVPSLTDKSDDLDVTRLYAVGHFAAGCMAAEYGETKMLLFVEMLLREGMDRDSAARVAFGQNFKTVDKTCVKWIKSKL